MTTPRTTAKLTALRALGKLRQRTRWPGYKCIGDYHSGKYESEFVSPYTKSAHNPDASFMILLQDWASDKVLCGPFLQVRADRGHDPQRGTNRNLKELLRTHFRLDLADTFATNIFPFVKLRAQNARIPQRDLVRAAREFACRRSRSSLRGSRSVSAVRRSMRCARRQVIGAFARSGRALPHRSATERLKCGAKRTRDRSVAIIGTGVGLIA